MDELLPTSVQKVHNLLTSIGVFPRPNWGQNFLIDNHLQEEIVAQAELTGEELVLEIGCGLGHLTQFLVKKTKALWVVEIDSKLAQFVSKRFQKNSNVRVWNEDALSSKHELNPTFMQELLPLTKEGKWKVVSNLPYSIATPVIVNLLSLPSPPSSIVVTVQKEVADRLTACPNCSDYGYLSIHAKLHSSVKVIRKISPGSFYPKPKVDSALVKIIPTPLSYKILDEALMLEIVKFAFQMRRKTLWNTLRQGKLGIQDEKLRQILEHCGISPQARGESLSVEQFVKLTNTVFQEKVSHV